METLIVEPERVTVTVHRDEAKGSTAAYAPVLLSLRAELIARLLVLGWREVQAGDVLCRAYLVRGFAHLVALHTPRALSAVMVRKTREIVALPLNDEYPPLTIGVLLDNHAQRDDCLCASIQDEEERWSCWQYQGLARDNGGQWAWAYTPASTRGITRRQQCLHELGQSHSDSECQLCKLHLWADRTSRLKLPDRIDEGDAQMHLEGAPHAATACTACHTDFMTKRM